MISNACESAASLGEHAPALFDEPIAERRTFPFGDTLTAGSLRRRPTGRSLTQPGSGISRSFSSPAPVGRMTRRCLPERVPPPTPARHERALRSPHRASAGPIWRQRAGASPAAEASSGDGGPDCDTPERTPLRADSPACAGRTAAANDATAVDAGRCRHRAARRGRDVPGQA